MRFGNVTRLSFGLVALTCALVLLLDLVGILPRAEQEIARERVKVCEDLAVQAALGIERRDFGALRTALTLATRRNEDVLSAGYRDRGGRLLAATRNHARFWQPESASGSTITHARVPLLSQGREHGTIEVRFAALTVGGSFLGLLSQPVGKMLIATATLGFLAYLLYMRRALRFLDPSAVIPPRVQAALDVMAEGVLLIDDKEQVVLANAAFADYLNTSANSLLGTRASELAWRVPGSGERAQELPWVASLRESRTTRGAPLALEAPGGTRLLMVSAAPVLDGGGNSQGAIVTLDDVTELERKSAELQETLVLLEKSRDEVRLQNDELQVLASSDPLTGIANRRTFMARLDGDLESARSDQADLCCIMADIDHFKRVNDDHGHATGDAAIVAVARALYEEVKDRERVCRYGGEEFCILLWDTPVEDAVALAERLRQRVSAEGFTEVPITASFGVTSLRFGGQRSMDLVNQADEALYASKQAGRNRVTRYDQI